MANRYFDTANSQLGAVYNPAVSEVSGQTNTTQQLYDMLVSSLGQQQLEGTREVVDSAARRGVSRASLEGQVSGTLGQEAELGTAMYGAQEAGDLATIAQAITGLRKGRVEGAAGIGGTMQDQALTRAEALENEKLAKAEANLEIVGLERDAEFAKQKKAYEAAEQARREAAARASYSSYSQGGGSSSGGSGGSPGATATYKNGKNGAGGYSFWDAQGNPISAAKYAQITGKPLGQLLYSMGQAGDAYAGQVYRQIKAASGIAKGNTALQNTMKKAYSPLFWGT